MQLITPTLKPISAFAHLSGRTVTTTPSRSLRRRMRTPAPLTVSQWADQHRRVTEIDAKPGRWRNEMVPHAVPIMDSISKPWVRQVWICLPERGAKTQILLNTVCWGIDQGAQAGNIFWLMPTEADARKALGERIIPAFRAKDDHGRPGRIARYLSHAADDTSRGSIRFNHGIRLFPAWANSPGSMASYFGRINIADECDKFPERTSEGTDPITLFLKRARDDRHRSKYVFASTPAGKFIHKGTMACQQINRWALRCPDCGDYVLPTAEHLSIPEGTTIENISDASLHIACPACGTLWDEEARAVAYHGGRSQVIKGEEHSRAELVGHHTPAYYFPIIPLTEICAAYLRMQTGDHAAKVAWANGYEVIDYVEEKKDRQEDAILRLRDSRPAGMVPLEADGLTLIADTQDRGFWFEVRAWRYGIDLKSWLVRSGYVPSSGPRDFSGLDAILAGDYRDAEGNLHRIGMHGLDTGGHRTSECYDWCRATGGLATKGATNRKTRPVSVNRLDVYPDGRVMPGGLNLYSIDTHYHKDMLANKLPTDISDPGAWVLHSGYSKEDLEAVARGEKLAHNLEDYARQFCAEYRDERGLWICPEGKANHLFDCAQMGLALVTFLGWQHLSREEEDHNEPEAVNSGGFVNRWR